MRLRLIKATREGELDEVMRLISQGTDANARSECGNTALHLATKFGYVGIVDFLVSNGADVNASNEDGNTGLH